jgi:hypothetical protein
MKVICQQCGIEFNARTAQLKIGKGKYCTPACSQQSRIQRVTVPCSFCGTPITRRPTLVNKAVVYCNGVCRNKHVAMKDRPAVEFDGNLVQIPLSQGQFAVVDKADYDSIPSLKEIWSAMWSESGQTFYAYRKDDQKQNVYMHREITGAPDDMDVNHRDNDGLNNTRENIEVCTRAENLQHRRKKRRYIDQAPVSKYKGVTRDESNSPRWVSRFRGVHLGCFDSEEEAAEAYNRAAAAAYGHFAKPNVIG